jgi:predicted TIM-barrel fold metal-dependent hydrolase
MNRRTFLFGPAASLLAAGGPAIVDTHIHLYDPTRPQGVPWPPKTDSLLYKPTLPDDYAALVRPLGVTGAIVIEASPWLEDNQWVLDLAAKHPIILGLVGHLEPGAAGFAQNLARFHKNPRFLGIRLSGAAIKTGIAKPVFLDDLRRLADAGLALDAIGDAGMIAPLVTLGDRIPALRIAVDHMPEEPPGWQESPAMRDLAKRPGVFAKVSGVLKARPGSLDLVLHLFGPDRVMYGSNWPVSNRVAPYPEVLAAVRKYVTAADAPRFFARNALACYRWPEH